MKTSNSKRGFYKELRRRVLPIAGAWLDMAS